jgi:uncharacterized protein YifN (PemK superfamily)
MPIHYQVPPGTVLLCDYSMGGFREPEMVKKRPAVVISPRLRGRDNLSTVVPLSGTAPKRAVPYQCWIEMPQPLPAPWDAEGYWAKADMLATVGLRRLDLFRTGRDQEGKRKYLRPRIPDHELRRVRACVLNALGMPRLTDYLP